ADDEVPVCRLLECQMAVGIKDGKIVQIGKSLSGAARTIDASGKYVLPRRHRQTCRTDHPSCGTA
ncbi:hypothetical protein ACC689_35330, partial [Rhizobium ruizarguesonis]